MKTALLVIDAQASFTQRPFWRNDDLPAYLAAQNTLIRGCQARQVPVVRIFHANAHAPDIDAFALGSPWIRPLDGLTDFAADATFTKNRHSALVGTGLDVWLTEHGIQGLIVSGIRTEQCCETTARHASDLGWRVDYVLDATLTFDMTTPDGQTLAAADIKTRTATVLAGRFARICTVDAVLSGA